MLSCTYLQMYLSHLGQSYKFSYVMENAQDRLAITKFGISPANILCYESADGSHIEAIIGLNNVV